MPLPLKIIHKSDLYLRLNAQWIILFGYVYYAHLVVLDLFFTTKITYVLSLYEWQLAGIKAGHK